MKQWQKFITVTRFPKAVWKLTCRFSKIGKTQFEWMKPTAYIINTARGKIINERDLIDAVSSGKIAGAFLDVIRNEPAIVDDPMLQTPGIFVTPHVSYLSVESMRALNEYAVGNLVSVLRGEEPLNPVV
ncbi:MAG: NAD(P)-dependent oxidoreductase [Peptoniphilaceae bacterium]|nr:NAD(P)-dependent oxidoreductase [Peptoniphilaceae bacterium]MDY6086193.1 NAD(P)-dependent oxidoreductase [Peptoniphilaceae bacterium]